MMNPHFKLLTMAVVLLTLTSTCLSAFAHEEHVFKAPWDACADAIKTQQCAYTNAHGDLFKGTCRVFNEALMCVRNQPIITAEKVTPADVAEVTVSSHHDSHENH
ncbi:hypothetical protein [Shewanella ulleungensis]|uniref:DUF3551 domain-containing protein n=1 Tax=Shewanella ulleungensis TaxID=2282699 RepID=A0ABQ2QVC7_9GAMM|nr:hypothetical protein [Shewanella ulleungensis]MCL1152137.1 hypothetical protein [Shewanella ulleungensis]GGP99557.1 hypothetical protein GCM10009410_36680 [Shewanella ulleungensis]